jgi:mRNA interferase RelE/StbE
MFRISYASTRILRNLRDPQCIPTAEAARILQHIQRELTTFDPKQPPKNIKKLEGDAGWRLRVGDYRIIFQPDFTSNSITVLTIKQRGGAYE